jgi:hypothetical protein
MPLFRIWIHGRKDGSRWVGRYSTALRLAGVLALVAGLPAAPAPAGASPSAPPPVKMPEPRPGPVVSGTPAVGETLVCEPGASAERPSEELTYFTYTWLRDGASIQQSTTGAYVVQAADAGHALACEVMEVGPAGVIRVGLSAALHIPPTPHLGAEREAGGGSSSGGSSSGGSPGGGSSESSSQGGRMSGGGGEQGALSEAAFALDGVQDLTAHGKIALTVTLPGPGAVQIVGRATRAPLAGASRTTRKRIATVIARLRLDVSRAGRIVATLAPTGGAETVLAERGELAATVTITYTPPEGQPKSIVRTVLFRLKRRR